MRNFLISLISMFLIFVYASKSEAGSPLVGEPILPLPYLDKKPKEEKVILGEALFKEPRLSKTNQISCSSCHDLNQGGSDHRAVSIGINGTAGEINSPTVFNSSLNFRQFWDGRAVNLEDQIDGPIQHPKEMGSTWAEIVEKLKQDPSYSKKFSTIYNDGVTVTNIKDAIASFEKTLITSGARFDRYLSGDSQAINDLEKTGYEKFKSYGCVACHQGVNIGGNMFQTMGVMGNYFKDRKTPITLADLGRYNVTKLESDKHVFRVPSLRNIELTAPYFHDGSAETLPDAINVMARYQLGRKLSGEDVKAIEAFLKSLTSDNFKSSVVSTRGK